MPFANTEPLRRELAAALPKRGFTVRFWDGTELPATTTNGAGSTNGDVDHGPIFTVRSPKAVAHVCSCARRARARAGLRRRRARGRRPRSRDRADRRLRGDPRSTTATRARLALAALRACGLTLPPRAPKGELRLKGGGHHDERDARAVRHHYDVSNEFFELFLDKSMTYSCAIFSRGAKTLEEAQFAKLDLVCKKLKLKEGERVLDVGAAAGGRS